MLDFPNAPQIGDSYSNIQGVVWTWDGVKWVAGTTTGTAMAPINSPTFTGDPKAPTPDVTDNDNSLATTAFVKAAIAAGGGGSSATISVGDSPPASPGPGALWWDSSTGNLFIYYNDGNTSQWTTASNIAGIANAALKTDLLPYANNAGRNLIHNPLFAIAQRGNGPWSGGGFGPLTADRWRLYTYSDTSNASIVSVNDTQRNAIGDEAATSALSVTVTTGTSGGSTQLWQTIEKIRRLSGKTVTVSFWAWAASGTPKIGVSLDQLTGSGGSPSGPVAGVGKSVTISNIPTRYSLTFAVGSINGMTLGTNGDDYTQMNFWLSAGAGLNSYSGSIGQQTGTFSVWGVQLEIGAVATPLEKPDPQQDLAKCQRFFVSSTQLLAHNFYAYGAGQTFYDNIQFHVPMRAVPTLTPGGISGGNMQTASLINPSQFGFATSVVAIATGGVWCNIAGFTASADL